MTKADGFPPVPRNVRRSAAYGRRWLLGVIGGVALLSGVTLVSFVLAMGAGLPFEDQALDAEGATTSGEIVRRTPTGIHLADGAVIKLAYTYRVQGVAHEQTCYATSAAVPAASTHVVEFLPRDPRVSRLLGTSRAAPARAPWSLAGFFFAAGFVLVALWLRASIAQRQLLRGGTVARGEVQRTRRIACVNPPQLAVEFTFRDRERRVHTGRQWCAAKSPLGQALLGGQREVLVVHDPVVPTRCSLATRESFEPAHGAD